MKLHICALDPDERDFFTGKRLHRVYISVWHSYLSIAYTPSARFAQHFDNKTWRYVDNTHWWQGWVTGRL